MANEGNAAQMGSSKGGGDSGPKFKMGTFTGVLLPTTLNIWSILVFLRFGFILGQVGVLGFLGMLIACYGIDLLTFASLSAIATNGKVRGGGAYYLVSRSLGPEFGGAIGIVYYLGQAFNTGMNAVGFVKCLTYNFGQKQGQSQNWLPDSFWYAYLWSTCLLWVATAICLAGSSLFAKASNFLFVIIFVAIYSIPVTAVLAPPYDQPSHNVEYTGINSTTFRNNLYPHFTAGADGSVLEGKESWRSLFGVLFPATAGIFAGASMSGDLKNPGKSIPRGTAIGLIFTFVTYVILILSLGSTITRDSFYGNSNIIQDTSISGTIVLVGELSVTGFGALFGVIGSAKMLQAIARDKLLPGLTIFGQGSQKNDEPRFAILITYAIAQMAMLFDINQIAGLVTMSFLLTFLVTNLACFLLKIGSAPNFRPSFRYFSWQSASLGAIVSCLIMGFVNESYAMAAVVYMVAIFLVIHYFSTPKSWGDVSQSLIYHQVRKYLLRLRSDHVKFWRPSVLLLINDPRSSFKLIQFCNSLKKGALFILGHVIVTDDFKGTASEAKRQLNSWNKYIDFSQIKAFTNISIAPRVEWGIRNLVLNSGLGGMRPNIVILGFYNMEELRKRQPLVPIPSPQPSRPVSRRNSSTRISSMWSKMRKGALPTDADRREGAITPQSYVSLLEDLLHGVRINVAIAKGFEKLNLPDPAPPVGTRFWGWLQSFRHPKKVEDKACIDLWPIQMSTLTDIDSDEVQGKKRSILTSNFDTYTLILQLGAILESVSTWRTTYKLRVSVFVEYENEVEEERSRLLSLLGNLRIEAEVRVFWLAEGNLKTYEAIVNGKKGPELDATIKTINEVLKDESWWSEVQDVRKDAVVGADLRDLANLGTPLPTPKNVSRAKGDHVSVARLKKVLKNMKRSVGHLDKYHPAMRVRMSPLDQQLIDQYWGDSDSDEEAASEVGDDESISSRTTSTRGGSKTPQVRRGDIEDSFFSQPRRTAMFSRASEVGPGSPSRPIAIHREAGVSEPGILDARSRGSSRAPTPTYGTPTSSAPGSYLRPYPMRHQSLPKFSSRPVPPTRILHDSETGPSITFADQMPDPHSMLHFERLSRSGTPPQESALSPPLQEENEAEDPAPANIIAEAPPLEGSDAAAATGFPFMSSIAMSFNDLPARAQNLILNDMIAQNSSDSGVIFTTLAGPVEGTADSEEECVRYLSDLEVLCAGIEAPMLLTHSNTVTVTVSL